MRRNRGGFDAVIDWACDGFVVLFGLWSALSHAVVLLGGSGLVLARLSVIVPVLGAAFLFLISRDSRRARPASAEEESVPERQESPHLAGLAGGVALSLFYVLTSNYVLFWTGGLVFLSLYYFLHLRAPRIRPVPVSPGPAELAVFALLACAVLFLALFVHRPHPDDSLYLSVAVDVHDHPEARLMSRDTIHGIPGLPFLAPQHRLRTYDVLVGQTARLLGIKPVAAAHLIFPPLFALVFLAAAAKILRLLLGRAWLYGLAAVIVILAVNGDMETSYGNSGLVLLFQGRGVLAIIMVPLLAAYGLEFMSGLRPAPAAWALLLLGQAAAVSFSTNAVFIGPIAAGLAMAAAWRPEARNTLRLAAGALACLYPLALGLYLKSGSVPEHFYQVSAPAWSLVAERGLNHVLGWKPFMAFWLSAFLGGWSFLRDRPRRRWMIGFSFLFLLIFMNPALAGFWASNVTSVVTFFRLYWALPLPFFLAALLAGAPSALARINGKPIRPALFAAVLLAFALLVPARRTFAPENGAYISRPGLKVPETFYALAEMLSAATPKGSLVLAPETVAAWLPTIPGHPGAVVAREMFLTQFTGRMDEDELWMRRAAFLYIGGAKRLLTQAEMDALLARTVDDLRVGSVAVTRSNSWRSRIEVVLLAQGFIRADSPSRHFLVYLRPARLPVAPPRDLPDRQTGPADSL